VFENVLLRRDARREAMPVDGDVEVGLRRRRVEGRRHRVASEPKEAGACDAMRDWGFSFRVPFPRFC
jgi:hypothetical protein